MQKKDSLSKITYIVNCLASDFRIPYNDPRRTSTLDHAIDFCAQNNIDVFDYKGELKLIKELKDKIKSSVQL